jgi:hypothetical protein
LGSWQNVALVVGILVLLLDVLLTSPFTLYYISDWPMHFSTLAAFVVIAVWLLPNVAQGKRLVGDVVRVVVVAIGLRAVWLAINLALAAVLYLVSPQLLVELFEVVIRTSSRSAAVSAGRVVQDAGQLLLGAGIGQASFLVAMSASLVSFLLADIWFKRRVFTWYGFRRIVLVCWGITLTFALFLGTVVLIPLTALIMGRPETLFSPMSLLLIIVAVLMTGIGLLAFVQADRRHGRRCPKCGACVPGSFELGKQCQKCQGELHPWLNASY